MLLEELRPDLYARQRDEARPTNIIANSSQQASRPGLTPIQESAYERHAPVANAVVRSRNQGPRPSSGSAASGEAPPQASHVGTSAAAPGEITQEVKARLGLLYEHYKAKFLADGFSAEEADAAAQARVRIELDKLCYGAPRQRSQRSTSPSSAGPRSSSGAFPRSLATVPSSAARATSATDRRPSISRETRPASSLVNPTATREQQNERSPQTSTRAPDAQAMVSALRPRQEQDGQAQGRRAKELTVIRTLRADGWSIESANIIVQAVQRGTLLETAKRIARKVERGASLEQAIVMVKSENADA